MRKQVKIFQFRSFRRHTEFILLSKKAMYMGKELIMSSNTPDRC